MPSSAAPLPWSRGPEGWETRGQSWGRDPVQLVVLIGTIALGAIVTTMAVTAAAILATVDVNPRWVPVLQGVITISFQALAIGALGGLAKLFFDGRREREAKENEIRERRHRYINGVVDASHRVDNARLVLRANRSVRTWSDIVNNDIIPARTQLRQLTHDLRNWTEAQRPVFRTGESIADLLEEMYGYLGALVDEYADHKTRLSEIQLAAERTTGADRAALLTEIWREVRSLRLFGDYVDDGSFYAGYRGRYLDVLREMRSSLVND